MGPSAIRYADLQQRLTTIGYHVEDEGNIQVPDPSQAEQLDKRLLNLEEVIKVNTALAEKVNEVVQKKRTPLVLGGDHSIAIGTLAGLSMKYKNMGVIWFDAHADLNTPDTTPSGNIHGMPLATSLGLGHEKLTSILHARPKIKAQNIIIIGGRSIDEGERFLIKERGIKVYTMHEIDRLGMTYVMEETMKYFNEQQVDGLHL